MEATTKDMQTFTTTEVEERQPVRPKVRIHRFSGEENHLASLVEGSVATRTYRQNSERGSIKGMFFGRSILNRILEQPGCVGIRSYFGAYNDGTPTLVLVGLKENGNDMLFGAQGGDGLPCPPFCGHDNNLNADLEDRLIPVRKNTFVFTGDENHSITIAEAKNFVENYRKDKEEGSVKGIYFSRSIYEKILSQSDCVGTRFYFGQSTNETQNLIVVGANSNGDDIAKGFIGDFGLPCPPFCGHDERMSL
jgi:hypothetical protein